LVWLSSYVTSHHLPAAPQSVAKDQFNFSVYYITLNSSCETQKLSQIWKKIVGDRVKSQN
jgi:hypothetical protein